ncbi:N-acetylmuramidase domain-containing protein [Celerinatantimonas sp. MCCC 1A17872]|uniref:N-acetylmuramidase domain-containing protein n=1 Tax=Celerinatantimonas sp. MCCC 1A17872 TaxID=3177514 RepID=UPI0038C792FE
MKQGDRGANVRHLQQLLKKAGYAIEADGDYGPATEKAVQAFQKSTQLVPDGCAGAKTLAALSGKPTDKYLKMPMLKQGARQLDVPLAAILAVNEVESRGCGFDEQFRPVILFERHIMYRRLQAKGLRQQQIDAIAKAHPNLVNASAGGYEGGAAEWQRLNDAKAIDEDCAIEAASWGLFQIMGMHWQRLGYASAKDWQNQMQASESAQFIAFTRFIKASHPLLSALRSQHWADFASGYNGPNYQRNAYDAKLARAYTHYLTRVSG